MTPGEAEGSDLSPASREVLRVLEEYTTFSWLIFERQCELVGFDPATLEHDRLGDLVPHLCKALARFTTIDKAEKFRTEISGRAHPVTPISKGTTGPVQLVGAVPALRDFSLLSESVVRILSDYTPLAWEVLETQCMRLQIDPYRIEARELEALLPYLRSGIARFTSPEKGTELRDRLRALM